MNVENTRIDREIASEVKRQVATIERGELLVAIVGRYSCVGVENDGCIRSGITTQHFHVDNGNGEDAGKVARSILVSIVKKKESILECRMTDK